MYSVSKIKFKQIYKGIDKRYTYIFKKKLSLQPARYDWLYGETQSL